MTSISLTKPCNIPPNPHIHSQAKSNTPFKGYRHSLSGLSKGWEYADACISLFCNAMQTNIAILKDNGLSKISEQSIKSSISNLETTSTLINFPINVTTIPSKIKNIRNSIHWQDRDGAIFRSVSFSVSIGYLFDSLTTLVNKTLNFLSLQKVSWMSTLSSRIYNPITGISLINDSLQLYQLVNFHRKFNKKIRKLESGNSSVEKLNKVVSSLLKNRDCTIPIRSRVSLLKILERKTSDDISEQFKKLIEIIDEKNESCIEKSKVHLQRIAQLLKKEERNQAISFIASTISAIAMGIFFYQPGTILKFSLYTASSILSLGLIILKDVQRGNFNTNFFLQKNYKCSKN